MNCRAAAARVVASILSQQGSLSSLLPQYADKLPLKERPLFQDLCYGTLRWYPRIAAILEELLSKPLKAKDLDIQALLAIGIYQLSETRIPDHAALNETVAAINDLKKQWGKGLVNGVLRNYIRQQAVMAEKISDSPAYQTAHPGWMVNTWKKAFPQHYDHIVTTNNQRAPMTLRVNQMMATRNDYLQRLEQADIKAEPTTFSSVGIRLSQPTDVNSLPGFSEGLISVQDEAPQLAGEILDPQPGERILDACCAPGGKTCHLLEATQGEIDLLALDCDAERMERVRENLDRLSLTATLKKADVINTDDWWGGQPFDRILLDAPCSATGVIRRHPDIKLLRRPEDVAKLSELQLSMLGTLWSLLREGGCLLYATCSIFPQENERVIKAFLEQTANARSLTISGEWGISTELGKQLLPQTGGHDGFYYAKLQKF